MEQIKQTVFLGLIFGAFIGYVCGIATGIGVRGVLAPCPSLPTATPRPSPTAAVVVAQCDTDTDCLEKFGCGGYADPCELPPVNIQLDPYCRKHPKARACDEFCKRVDCRE